MAHDGMSNTAPPDGQGPQLILVGDSHVKALHAGCMAHGIPAAMLKSGGIHWNAGKIRVFAPRRARSPVLPALTPDIRTLEQTLGHSDIFDSGLPVIASVGFHCGHLARAFGAEGHIAWPPPEDLSDAERQESLFASGALVAAFVENQRAPHFALLKYIARKCPLTVILPPRAPKNAHKIRFRHNIDVLTATIAERMRDMGLAVYDPNAEFAGPGELLPWDWVEEDGFHGTTAYGTEVIGRLVSRGALAPAQTGTREPAP
ncbi:hypothetical protein [Rhodovulum adriaticum]|uniref:GDSL-like lipase/acylhydrolase family protein n=1 Tax=Rhodovulum adriaticum TaxID=35804 RepID=A0A4R2NY16_RHOAD|nr:hypothetical protein [Rhodovulum adriaticum]MBK1636324.1 hypothetical protein [Rhodovulum adriaticum]TCP26325.1 hypothetical protein EV656_102290 [Rhodovulum adriaticum]